MRALIGCVLCTIGLMVVLPWAGGAGPLDSSKLAEPVRLKDGTGFIDVSVGHSIPFVVDWNGDGKRDLLVGQFEGGKLRAYLNKGANAAPKFKGFAYVKAGKSEAAVPYG